jgi:hypothetical protein
VIIAVIIAFVLLAVLTHHHEYGSAIIIASLAAELAVWAIIALVIGILVAAIKLRAGRGAIIAIIASLIIIFVLLGFRTEYPMYDGITLTLIAGFAIWIAYIIRSLYLRNKRLSERGAEQGLTQIKSLKDQF